MSLSVGWLSLETKISSISLLNGSWKNGEGESKVYESN